jgi:hypothetical protein
MSIPDGRLRLVICEFVAGHRADPHGMKPLLRGGEVDEAIQNFLGAWFASLRSQ